jgi:hypothetical protein
MLFYSVVNKETTSRKIYALRCHLVTYNSGEQGAYKTRYV